MAIYRDLFFNNVASLLAGTFPVLRRLLGEDEWRELLTDEQYDSLPGSERWTRRLDPQTKQRKQPELPRGGGTGTAPEVKDPKAPGRGRGEQEIGGGQGGTSSM